MRHLGAKSYRRAALALLLILFSALGWRYLPTLAPEAARWLHAASVALHRLTRARPLLACAAFLAAYTLANAACLPVLTVFSVAAGAAFGWPWAMALCLAGATLGTAIACCAIRRLTGTGRLGRLGRSAEALRRRLDGGTVWALLSLRLLSLFPVGLLTIAAGLTALRLRDVVWTTMVGLAPSTALWTAFGAGAGRWLGGSSRPSLLQPHWLLLLCGLALLALLPPMLRRWLPFLKGRT